MNKSIAIIPARGGSKRIPRKNILDFCGKPIIAYSIEAALKSGVFDSVMVSTDDKEIAEIAKLYGASVPFFRSGTTSDDFAPLADVVKEVLDSYSADGKFFETFCCILPTAPFIDGNIISEAFVKLTDTEASSIFPVVEYSYPIQRALQFNDNNIQMIYPENMFTRSQDLERTYHDAGQFYFLRTEAFFAEGTLFTRDASALKLSHLRVQDIDTEEDWQMAQLKYKLFNEKEKNNISS